MWYDSGPKAQSVISDSRYSESKRGKGHLTRDDFKAIRDGFQQAGLDRDYFDFYDVCYLADQGKTIEQIVQAAIDHHNKEVQSIKDALRNA